MRRFIVSVRRLWWAFVLLFGFIWPLGSLVRTLILRSLQTETARGIFGKAAPYFIAHPALIIPSFTALTLSLILFYCFFEGVLSGRPFMRVEGMPWRGPMYLTGADGKSIFANCASVVVTNMSEGITEEATAKNLSATITAIGKGRRLWPSIRGVWHLHGKQESRIDLHPEDAARLYLAIENKKRGVLVPATEAALRPYRADDPSGEPLDQEIYLLKVKLRGIGVNKLMWFALEDFVSREKGLGIWGPLNIFGRVWLRLSQFGIAPKWVPYIGRDQHLAEMKKDQEENPIEVAFVEGALPFVERVGEFTTLYRVSLKARFETHKGLKLVISSIEPRPLEGTEAELVLLPRTPKPTPLEPTERFDLMLWQPVYFDVVEKDSREANIKVIHRVEYRIPSGHYVLTLSLRDGPAPLNHQFRVWVDDQGSLHFQSTKAAAGERRDAKS